MSMTSTQGSASEQPAAAQAPQARSTPAPSAPIAAESPGQSAPGQAAHSQTAAESADQALARAQLAAQAKRLSEASGICEDVLAANPDYPAALALLGIVMAMKNDLERGVELMRKAISLRPGIPSWYAHLSSMCRNTYRMEEAVQAGQESIRLDPNNADHLVNMSLVFVDVDDRERAIACLLRALGLKHDHADGHLAMAQILLAQRDFKPGWAEYEWRNLTEAGKATMPAMTSAHWNGMRIPTGRLLLVGDQGYGDTIQFARYIGMAAERVQDVILGCSQEMGPLLENIPGVAQYCHRWNDVPGHAVHCRLSSLPHIFGTTPDTIPAKVPYLFAEPERAAHWRDRLDASLPRGLKRIGLAWTGRPTHPNDRRRSVRLSRLLPLTEAGPAAFVSLQKPMPEADREAMKAFNGMTDLSADLTDFGETAALIQNLDLVITVDTSMGHLAGAMAKPIWVLVPKASDWRWQLDREDSPWYPTARLFRQAKPGEWDPVLARLTAALAGELRQQVAAD
jgi:tetratricopeptide (TPR) repeat protein